MTIHKFRQSSKFCWIFIDHLLDIGWLVFCINVSYGSVEAEFIFKHIDNGEFIQDGILLSQHVLANWELHKTHTLLWALVRCVLIDLTFNTWILFKEWASSIVDCELLIWVRLNFVNWSLHGWRRYYLLIVLSSIVIWLSSIVDSYHWWEYWSLW